MSSSNCKLSYKVLDSGVVNFKFKCREHDIELNKTYPHISNMTTFAADDISDIFFNKTLIGSYAKNQLNSTIVGLLSNARITTSAKINFILPKELLMVDVSEMVKAAEILFEIDGNRITIPQRSFPARY